MNRADFRKCEYVTLREEIKETKGRIFRLAGLGIIGMPSSYFLAATYELEILILSLPILICIVLLLYISESRALMRGGRYIKTKIESYIEDAGELDVKGWEHWLEQKTSAERGRRTVDKLVTVFFYILFLFYYIASVSLAVETANSQWGVIGFAVTIGFYVGTGILFIGFLGYCFKHSTSTGC